MPGIGFISHDSVLNGAPITLAELVIELARKAYPERVALGFPVAGRLLRRYDFSGVELFIYGRSLFGRRIPVGRPEIRRRLRKIFAARKFDLVAANSLESFRAVEAAADLGIPVLWLIHELAASYQGRREWPEIRRAAARAERLIFNSRTGLSQAGLLGEELENKSRVIYPGIRPPVPEAGSGSLKRELAGKGRAPVIGTVGDICPQKGYGDLIEAFSAVARVRPGAILVIVGRVPARFAGFKHQLDARIRETDLTGRVLFAGEISEPGQWQEAIDLLVHPSPQESFGRTVAEALSRGIPVVAARSGGVEEIITDGESGYLVPARDPDALADAVLRTLNDPENARKMALRGRREVEARFSLGRFAGEMKEEIESLL